MPHPSPVTEFVIEADRTDKVVMASVASRPKRP